MLRKRSQLPIWAYGAVAGLLVIALAATWARTDTLPRAELLIPAVFWTTAFIIIALRRRSAGS